MKMVLASVVLMTCLLTGCEEDMPGDNMNHTVYVSNRTDSTVVVFYSQQHYDDRFFLDHLQADISVGNTLGISTYFVTAHDPGEVEIEYKGIRKKFFVDAGETLTVSNADFHG